jgi:hypothetical protein
MPRGKSITHREDMITSSSSNSDVDDHELLRANREQTPEAHALTHDVGSLSVMPQR